MNRMRGSVTAEFAIALPGVLLIVAALFQGIQLVHQQVALTSLTQQASRTWLIDGEASSRGHLAAAHPELKWRFTEGAGTRCIDASRLLSVFGVAQFTIQARSCVAG